MARTGISYEEVAAVADGLISKGEQPTINAIRATLGTGSPNTIHRHLTAWKQASSPTEQRKAPELPQELQLAIVKEIERQAAGARAEIEHKFIEAQSTANDLAVIGEELENKNADLDELNQNLSNQVQQLTALTDERSLELDKLTLELKIERENSEKTRLQLAQSLNKIETLESNSVFLNNRINDLVLKSEKITDEKIKAEQNSAVLAAKLESEKSFSIDLKTRLSEAEAELKKLRTETKAELYETNQAMIKALNDKTDLERKAEDEYREKVACMQHNNELENHVDTLNSSLKEEKEKSNTMLIELNKTKEELIKIKSNTDK